MHMQMTLFPNDMRVPRHFRGGVRLSRFRTRLYIGLRL